MNDATRAMAHSAVAYFESTVDQSICPLLDRFGLTPQAVRAALAPAQGAATPPVDPSEVRQAVVRGYPKRRGGGVRMPRYVVLAIYADYRQHGLMKAAAIHDRTHQSLLDLFANHRLPLVHMRHTESRTFGGHVYRLAKTGYFVRKWVDGSKLKHEFLHTAMYAAAVGSIPPGHRIIFKNGNRRDFSRGNLVCVTAREQIRLALASRHARRAKSLRRAA